MDIGKGLEHLAVWGALLVLGSIVASLCLMAGVLALVGYVVRLLRRRAAGSVEAPRD